MQCIPWVLTLLLWFLGTGVHPLAKGSRCNVGTIDQHVSAGAASKCIQCTHNIQHKLHGLMAPATVASQRTALHALPATLCSGCVSPPVWEGTGVVSGAIWAQFFQSKGAAAGSTVLVSFLCRWPLGEQLPAGPNRRGLADFSAPQTSSWRSMTSGGQLNTGAEGGP